MALTIGDRSHDGLLEIADTNLNSIPGPGLRVTVRELIGSRCWNMKDSAREARMRRLACKAVDSANVRASIMRRFTYNGCDYVTFFIL